MATERGFGTSDACKSEPAPTIDDGHLEDIAGGEFVRVANPVLDRVWAPAELSCSHADRDIGDPANRATVVDAVLTEICFGHNRDLLLFRSAGLLRGEKELADSIIRWLVRQSCYTPGHYGGFAYQGADSPTRSGTRT